MSATNSSLGAFESLRHVPKYRLGKIDGVNYLFELDAEKSYLEIGNPTPKIITCYNLKCKVREVESADINERVEIPIRQ